MPNILCQLEIRVLNLMVYVMDIRCKFVNKYINLTSGDEPLSIALKLCEMADTPMYTLIQRSLESHQRDPKCKAICSLVIHSRTVRRASDLRLEGPGFDSPPSTQLFVFFGKALFLH